MKLSDAEKVEVQNLMKMIRRASFKDFQGLEALALARAYTWLDSLLVEPKPEPVVEAPKEEPKPEPVKKSKKGKA